MDEIAAGAGMDVLYTKNGVFDVFVFFCFVCARPPVRSSSSSSSSFIDARAIRFDSVRFDSTRHARGRSRAVLARARADVRLVATTMRDVIVGIRWHPRRPDARERDEVDARGGARWRRMGFHPMRTCVRERTRTRARDATRRRWMMMMMRRRMEAARGGFFARRTRRRRWRRIGANFERGCWRVNERRRWRRSERERRRCRWKI